MRKAFSLALTMAVACSALPALAAEPVVVKLWDQHIHDKKFRQSIFKAFNKANPDIKVEYTSQVGDAYQSVLDSAFRTGTPPDIFVPTGAASIPKMIEMGWITPIDDVAPSREELLAWMARFPQDQQPFKAEANVFDGKVYSWPTTAEGGRMMLFWNTRLFREAGLQAPGGGPASPETWADLHQFARKITEAGKGQVYGIVHGIRNPSVWDQDVFWSLAVSAGWSTAFYGFNSKTGHYDFHSPGFRGAVQVWLDMKKDGSVFPGDLSMDDEQAKFRFCQDVAGMIFGGPWVPGGILAINPDLEFDAILPPTEVRGERKGYLGMGALAGSSEYIVSAKTKNRTAVWRVIQFMTSQQYQEEWVKAGGGFSVFPQYNKPEFFPHPTMAKIAQMVTTGRRTVPDGPSGSGQLMDYYDPGKPDMHDTMQGMWIGQLGWDAWDDLEKRSEKAFDKALDDLKRAAGVKLARADFTFPDWDPTQNYQPKGKK